MISRFRNPLARYKLYFCGITVIGTDVAIVNNQISCLKIIKKSLYRMIFFVFLHHFNRY